MLACSTRGDQKVLGLT